MPDEQTAAEIELLVLDVDGVLTDGLIHIDATGTETKTFHTRDGLGLRLWMRTGHHAAIITGRSSMTVQHRMNELGVTHVYQGVDDKRQALGELLRRLKLTASSVAVMGDDLPDLPMMRLCGYPIAVGDGAPEVRQVAEFVTIHPGGRGAVREAIEHLLKAKGLWENALAAFE